MSVVRETLHNPKVSDNIDMKQQSLNPYEFSVKPKRTRKREFLDEMDAVVPWSDLVQLVEPFAPKPGAKGGRPAFPLQTMLRIHFMQQWFGLSDPAMEEALHDVPMYQSFAHLDAGVGYIPDESTILRFRHLLGNVCTTRPNSKPHLIQLYKPDQMQKLIELALQSRFPCVFGAFFGHFWPFRRTYPCAPCNRLRRTIHMLDRANRVIN